MQHRGALRRRVLLGAGVRCLCRAASTAAALPATYPTFTDAVEFQRDLRSVVARVPVNTFTELRGQVCESVGKAAATPTRSSQDPVDPAEALKPGPVTAANRRLHGMIDVLGHVPTDEMLAMVLEANLDVSRLQGGRLSVALSLLQRLVRERRWPLRPATLAAVQGAFNAVAEAAERLQPPPDLLGNLPTGGAETNLGVRAHPGEPDAAVLRVQTLIEFFVVPAVEALGSLGVLPTEAKELRRLAAGHADQAAEERRRVADLVLPLLAVAGRVAAASAAAHPAVTAKLASRLAVTALCLQQHAPGSDTAALDAAAEYAMLAYAAATYYGAPVEAKGGPVHALAKMAATASMPRCTSAWQLAKGDVAAESSPVHAVNAIVRNRIEPETVELMSDPSASLDAVGTTVASIRRQVAAALEAVPAADADNEAAIGMIVFAHLRAELAAVHATARVLDASIAVDEAGAPAADERLSRALALVDAIDSACTAVAETWGELCSTGADEGSLAPLQRALVLETLTQLGRVPLTGPTADHDAMAVEQLRGKLSFARPDAEAAEVSSEEAAEVASNMEHLATWETHSSRRTEALKAAVHRLFPLAAQLIAAAEAADTSPITAPSSIPGTPEAATATDPEDPRHRVFNLHAVVAANILVGAGGAEALEAMVGPKNGEPALLGPLMELLDASGVTDLALHASLLWSLTRPAEGAAADVEVEQLLSLSIPEEDMEVDRALAPPVPPIPTVDSVAALGMTTQAYAVAMRRFEAAGNADACLALRRVQKALYDPAGDDVVLDINGLRNPNPKGL